MSLTTSGISGVLPLNINAADSANQTEKTSALNFSDVIAETLQKQAVDNAITLSGGNSSDSAGLGGAGLSSGGGGIEQMILAAATTGDVSKTEIALFMLCSMMQSNPDGEFSALFSMLASVLADTDSSGEVRSILRESVISSDYTPYTKSQIDEYVFQPPIAVSEDGAVIPVSCWVPTTPAVVSVPGQRNPELLRSVIDQFGVETEERYRPGRDGYTYCNIFVWDVTSALGCEIPHYADPATGDLMTYPNIKGSYQLGAIATEKWLVEHGGRYGWREADAETAQRYANEGKAAVTTAGQIGHVQIVCPSENGAYDPARGVTVAQAGSKVTNYTYISNIYGGKTLDSIRYFVHD